MAQAWTEKVKDAWWAIKRNRPLKIILLVIALLATALLILLAVLQYYGRLPWATTVSSTDRNTNTPDHIVTDVPALSARRLDGVMVATADSNRFPIAVMIENLVDIRPQAGLSSAGVVYEALAEGGITRMMAVYATTDSIPKIGPIRSARLYFVDWAEEYGGVYAYVGGSPQALGATSDSTFITDLNQFYNSQYYYRATDVEAPHNLFSTSDLFTLALRDLAKLETPGTYPADTFKAEAGPVDRPTATTPIVIDYSSADYQVEWRYDRDLNVYLRWNGGVAHTDANTAKQLQASNILIQRVNTTVLEAATGRLAMETVGSGEAILCQDGVIHTGTWEKTAVGERTRFIDESGEAWEYNPGSIWVEVVPTDTNVTY